MYRVLKQALRASGANVTVKHVEEISLGALFLLQAAKKTNQEFNVLHTTAHTTRDACGDIMKMSQDLLEKSVTTMTQGRQSSPFVDFTDKGWDKMSTGWLQDVLKKSSEEHLHEEADNQDDRGVDLDYALT